MFEFCQLPAAAAASPAAKCFEDHFLLRLFLLLLLLKNTSCNIVKNAAPKNSEPLLDSRNYDDEEDEPKKVSEASRQLQGGGETFFFFSFLPCRDVNGRVGEELFDASSWVGCSPAVYLSSLYSEQWPLHLYFSIWNCAEHEPEPWMTKHNYFFHDWSRESRGLKGHLSPISSAWPKWEKKPRWGSKL